MPTAGPSRAGRPLVGWRVVVTRSREQASELVAALDGLGAVTVELPVIAFADPEDGGDALQHAASALVAGDHAWVVLTSPNSVTRLIAALDGRSVPESVQWAVVGPGTARSLQASGFRPDLVPEVSVSDALAEAFAAPPPAGGSVLFPRAESVRGVLAEGLRSKGWTVEEVVAYRTVGSAPDPERLTAARQADAVAFTSSSTVARAVDLLGAGGLPPVVVTIGPVTSDAVRVAGLQVAAEAHEPTIEGLVSALLAARSDHRP